MSVSRRLFVAVATVVVAVVVVVLGVTVLQALLLLWSLFVHSEKCELCMQIRIVQTCQTRFN